MAKMSPYEKRLYTEFNLTMPQARAVAKDVKKAIKEQKKSGKMASADFVAGRENRARQIRTLGELPSGQRLTSKSAKAERGRATVRTSKKKK